MMPIAAMRLRATPPVVSAYRFWRVWITSNAGDPNYTGIQELELRIAGVDQTSPGGAASASSFFVGTGSQPASNAFDNDTTDPNFCWVTATGASYPHWLQYDFGSGNAKAIESAWMWPQARSDLVSRSPSDFLIEGSADGLDWTSVATLTGVSGWTTGVAKSFSLL